MLEVPPRDAPGRELGPRKCFYSSLLQEPDLTSEREMPERQLRDRAGAFGPNRPTTHEIAGIARGHPNWWNPSFVPVVRRTIPREPFSARHTRDPHRHLPSDWKDFHFECNPRPNQSKAQLHLNRRIQARRRNQKESKKLLQRRRRSLQSNVQGPQNLRQDRVIRCTRHLRRWWH